MQNFIRCLIVLISIWVSQSAWADLEVKVLRGTNLHEVETQNQSQTTIVGPRGKRVIRSRGQSKVQQYPTPLNDTTHTESESEVEVEGVKDPGIQVEHKDYYFNPGAQPHVITSPVVTGGPGSITTKSSSTTKSTPKVNVRITN